MELICSTEESVPRAQTRAAPGVGSINAVNHSVKRGEKKEKKKEENSRKVAELMRKSRRAAVCR